MTDLLAAYTLWWRELSRFGRQASRVASAVGTPILFWLLIGTGLSSSFRLPGGPSDVDYMEYFFPGSVVLLVLFSAIFSTFSVIEDRKEGFLQGVLVAPVSRWAVVAGKVLGGATLAWVQGGVFLVLAPLAGIPLTAPAALRAGAVLALLALALTAVGFVFAWRIDSTQGFHGVMNLLLVPMWLLSGAFFPLTGAPRWLEWVMRVNPLTYGVAALRRALYAGPAGLEATLPDLGLSLTILVLWSGAILAFGSWLVRRSEA